MKNPLRKIWPSADSASSVTTLPDNELLVQDRRVVARDFHPLPATVRYGLANSEDRVQIHNFSEKGLCFRSQVRFPVGAAVEVHATLPHKASAWGGRKVRYLAKVIRVAMDRGEFLMGATIYACNTVPQETRGAGKQAPVSDLGPTSDRRHSTPLAAKPRQPRACRPKPGESTAAKAGDSRQFSRYRCASQVQYRLLGDDHIASGELVNLSLAGCRVLTEEPCPLGSSVEIVLQLGRARIYTHGRVRGAEDKAMRVEFVGGLGQRLWRLHRFVELLRTAGDPHSVSNN